uniref:Uncharacterized protein n=1 Tax=Cyprinus carpio TaxID=7962 RepID=A0A8C1GLL6_CYPCA
NPSHLRELDLSGNKLEDSGVQICSLCRLVSCGITDEGCAALSSALTLNPTHLRWLDLSKNKRSDSGINLLSTGLGNPHCKLEMLGLHDCDVTDEGCAALASALRSNPSYLRELDLSDNKLGDLGVKLLSTGLENCKLEILKLEFCDVSDKGCNFLALALRSNPSHLKELDLSGNKITNSGLKILSADLQNPLCKLKKLLCGVTSDGCASLALVLRSNHSYLRGLNLSGNTLGDSGIKKFAEGLENPHCKLEILRLRDCAVTDEGCAALASALRSNPSHLRELDLSGNKFGDTGLQRLSVDLENSDCNLETLRQDYHSPLNDCNSLSRLDHCEFSNEGCAALGSALKSNPSHLRELDLGWNKLGDSGVQAIFYGLKDPNSKLEILR